MRDVPHSDLGSHRRRSVPCCGATARPTPQRARDGLPGVPWRGSSATAMEGLGEARREAEDLRNELEKVTKKLKAKTSRAKA